MSILQKLEQKRLGILEKIGSIRFMRRGTINEQYLPVKQKGKQPLLRGPYYVLSKNEDGKTKSQRLKKNEMEQVRQDVEAYREFQKLSKEYVDVTEALALQERSADGTDAVKKLICHEEYHGLLHLTAAIIVVIV